MTRPPNDFTTLDTRIKLCPSGKFAYGEEATAPSSLPQAAEACLHRQRRRARQLSRQPETDCSNGTPVWELAHRPLP